MENFCLPPQRFEHTTLYFTGGGVINYTMPLADPKVAGLNLRAGKIFPHFLNDKI